MIALSGLAGLLFLKRSTELPHTPFTVNLNRTTGIVALIIFCSLLLLLPVAAANSDLQILKYFDSFFRTGSLVFGGGHVILPLLQTEVVNSGWVSKETFMAGYGAAQAVPGPLFTFSAYLGAVSTMAPSGWLGAGICLLAIFLPSFLLILGILPFWEQLRQRPQVRNAIQGINAAVVGLLIAAFYNPVWTSAIFNLKDFAIALAALMLLAFWKTPSWAVVILGAAAGWAFLN